MLQTVAQATPYTSAHPLPSPATNVVVLHGISPTTPQDLPQQENRTNGPQNISTSNNKNGTTSPSKQLLQLPKGATADY